MIYSIQLFFFVSDSFTGDDHKSQYEEYDLDEQDFQWLIAYNQFRIEKSREFINKPLSNFFMQALDKT